MFTIPVGDILSSYAGDSKKFSFSGEIYDGYYSDLTFRKPLEFTIRIIALDDGVEVVFESLSTEVVYEGTKHIIQISSFERTFKTHFDPLSDPDDIRPIENMTIDLAPVIREEIIIATHF